MEEYRRSAREFSDTNLEEKTFCVSLYDKKIDFLKICSDENRIKGKNSYFQVLILVLLFFIFIFPVKNGFPESKIITTAFELQDSLFINAIDLSHKTSGSLLGNYWELDSNGEIGDTVLAQSQGVYWVTLRFHSDQISNPQLLLTLKIDSIQYSPLKIENYSSDRELTFVANIFQGKHSFTVVLDSKGGRGSVFIRSIYFHRQDDPYLSLAKEYASTVMKKVPDPGALGLMDWRIIYLLSGMSKLFEESHDVTYLSYIQKWANRHIDKSGNYDCQIDDMSAAFIIAWLYEVTGDRRYMKFILDSKKVFDFSYPRNKDGICLHMRDEIWDDTVAGMTRFLIQMGLLENNPFDFDTAAFQIIGHAKILQDSITGLFYHAYDPDGSQPWADPVTHLSPEFWGRGNGWLFQASTDLLAVLPDSSRYRNQLEAIHARLLTGITAVQDNSYLWKTVLDKTGDQNNYYENSATCIFLYGLEKLLLENKLNWQQIKWVDQIWAHLMSYIYRDVDGNWHLTHVSKGTGPGNYQHYLQIPIGDAIDDYFGSGLFLEALVERHRLDKNIRSFRGRVIYFSNQSPIANVKVSVNTSLRSFQVYSTADGSFEFPYHPLEKTSIHFEKQKFSKEDFILMYDAALVARHSVGLVNLSSLQQTIADVSGNNIIQMYDATLIARWVVGVPINGHNRLGEWGFLPDSLSVTGSQTRPVKVVGFEYGDVHGGWHGQATSFAKKRIDSRAKISSRKIKNKWIVSFPVDHNNTLISFTTVWEADFHELRFEGVEGYPQHLEKRIYFGENGKEFRIGSFSLNGNNNIDTLYFSWEEIGAHGRTFAPFLKSLYINGKKISIENSDDEHLVEESQVRLSVFPNPFNSVTSAEYFLLSPSLVKITIFNLQGKKVNTLLNSYQKAGRHLVYWNGKNEWDQPVGSGLYFLRIETNVKYVSEKILLIK